MALVPKIVMGDSFMNLIRLSNSLEIDQAEHFFRTDLGPKCVQMLSVNDKSHHCR